MFSFLFSVLSFLLLLSHSVTAAPVKPVELLAVAPHVTSPTAESTWTAGSSQTVLWDTKDVPLAAQGYYVNILLGYLENGSENLDTDNPLNTEKVWIMSGSAVVNVPDGIITRNNYIVVVNGDSGNRSDLFTIVGPSAESLVL